MFKFNEIIHETRKYYSEYIVFKYTSVILDKNNAKYNFYGSCEGSSTCKYIGQMGSKGQTRWADNNKGSKTRKHISIRVNRVGIVGYQYKFHWCK